MIARIIQGSIRHPMAVLVGVALLSILAVSNLRRLALDALPDLSDTQVIVFAEWPGRFPDLIEDQITYPLVTSLLAAPQVKYVRGISMVGATQILVVFNDGTDLYWARSRIAEKLAAVSGLPEGVSPTLGPEATGVGWVYQYALVDRTGQHALHELRALQDWNLRLALQSVPGVAEVAAVGGYTKQYQVLLDPLKLAAYGISPLQVTRALRAGNQDVGANVIEMGGTDFVIRGRGYVQGIADIEKIPLSVGTKGRVIAIGDVGMVQLGPAPRAGAGELDGDGEAVSGIVVMRMGENALNVIDRVKERLARAAQTLPPGVEIIPVYDRSTLISEAIATLKRVLMEEVLVVSLLVCLFLWHFRASLVTIIPLPIAVLLSFLPMLLSKLTVNIMSLGGIALAIGAMVDAGIILIENAHKKLEGKDTSTLPPGERLRLISAAMVEMGKPLFFSLLVITVSFIPIFALHGREGRLFGPLAFTKTFSMAWAAVLAITLTPALAALFLKGNFVTEERHPVSRWMHRLYEPVIHFVLRFPKAVIIGALALLVATVPIVRKLPTEFMPALNEGTILYMPTAVPGMSIDTAVSVMQKQNSLIKALPEVEHVYGKAGRANTATDPAPLNMFETVITLKPKDQWRLGMTYEKIVSELDRTLQFPGMPNIWWMPIQTRIEMLATGVRTAIAAKVLGASLTEVDATTIAIENVLRELPGTRSAIAERAQAGSYIDITVDRERAARYGLNIADVHNIVETVIAGSVPTKVVEGRERYSIQVRYAADFRSDLQAIADVIIPTPTGTHVKLGQIAQIGVSAGTTMINSENGRLLGYVYIDVDPQVGMDEYVDRAQNALRHLHLPTGVNVEFTGQFEALRSAKEVLRWIVPLTLLIIIILLFINTGSVVETGIVLLAVPFSLIGAFWLLWLLEYKLSVATWVGLLALAGLDAETGVVMLLYLTHAFRDRGEDPAHLVSAIHDGAVKRVRPKLMTVCAALFGLLPVMWSTGAGADVMKRIAAPMIGGIVTSGLLELLVYPAIFFLWKRKK